MSNTNLATIENAKTLAKRLRSELDKNGQAISHSKSLELLASQYGFRDWNTMHASIGNQPMGPLACVGQQVKGHYLGHSFNANVLDVQRQNDGQRYRITLDLDEAVDVVDFDSFSAYRKRISATIDQNGVTNEKNSKGVHILKLDL